MPWLKKSILSLSTVAALSMSAAIPAANASVFVWQADDQSVSASFPDSWQRISNQAPSTLLTIKAPGEYDFATCTISKTPDDRFKIYPIHYAAQIQREYVSQNVWDRYYHAQTNPVFHMVKDDSGLGRGFATMSSVSYETAVGPKMIKRAVAFASLYNKAIYVAECSAEQSAYPRWHNAFMSFMKSVDFKEFTNYALSGYYRNFISDADYKVVGPTIFDTTNQ
ncbi:MAG: hypothetical protein KDI46_08765 [Alphaproteobacteria bacterium]|nr:hypothetical protein [Alphaproteobacteria bacterium]